MSSNKLWLTKVGTELLSDLVTFSILSPYIPLFFHKSIQVVPLKKLMHFLPGINSKKVL